MTAPASGAVPSASADTPARDRILDGAARCFRRFGVTKTTLEDIAAEAGTSRATIYRTIPGGRDEIVLAVLLAESGTALGPVRAKMDTIDRFEDQMVEGVARAIELARGDPNMALLFTAETVTSSVVLPGAWDALVAANRGFIAPLIERARTRGEVRQDLSDDQISDWLCRFIVSILVVPGSFVDDSAELRDYLRTFMVPSLVDEVRSGSARRGRPLPA